MKVQVAIIETLKMVVEVEAENIQQAEEIVLDKWKNSEYILGAECFSGMKVEAV